MKKSFIDIIMNPTRSRIIQYLVNHKQATTLQISQQLKDVSKATLYRNISLLQKHKILFVAEEHKIRGTVEKVYTLNEDILNGAGNTSEAKSKVWNFMISLYRDFDVYFDKTEGNPLNERVFYNTRSMYLTNQEFDGFMAEFQQLLERYGSLPQGKESKIRNLTMISSPGHRKS